MLVLLVCITESVSETDGWHMKAAREGRTDRLYWFRQGNRQKGFSRIKRPLAAVVSRGFAQSTSHPNQPRMTMFGLWVTATPWPQVFSWKGIMAATALPLPMCSVTMEDWLTVLTLALLYGVSMFFTCQWEGKKEVVNRKWDNEAELLTDASGERNCSKKKKAPFCHPKAEGTF